MSFRRHRKAYEERAADMLERFGLGDRLKHRPSQLSGGERQRVAMARALFHDPQILLADEPTGNLDSATGEIVLELLFEEQQRRDLAMILVTHDQRLARRCQRILVIEDGIIQADSAHPVPD
jgi:putative ABC transport system ATP-binding protein